MLQNSRRLLNYILNASHEIQRWTLIVRNRLEQCCSLFPYSFDECCNTPGLGGCDVVGDVMYSRLVKFCLLC